MINLVKNIGATFLDLFFPKFCVLCSRPGNYLCTKCYKKICYYPYPPIINIEEKFIDQIMVCTKYQKPVPQLIKTMKYRGVKNIGQLIAKIMYYSTCVNSKQYQIITYIPISKKRKHIRGFNQAKIIANSLANDYQLPLEKLLTKKPRSKNQALLNKKTNRQKSIYNSFTFNQAKKQPNQNILLIDDVITTGSTLNEASRILKLNGAKKVDALVFAHK